MIHTVSGGTELLFWILTGVEWLLAATVYGTVCLVRKLRRQRHEIARLTAERDRFQTWLYYKSDSTRARAA